MVIKPDDILTVEMTARDALRAYIVLGRCNGSSTTVYFNIAKQIDPQGLFRRFDLEKLNVSSVIGIIDYRSIQDNVECQFFSKQEKRFELAELQTNIEKLTNQLCELKKELGIE